MSKLDISTATYDDIKSQPYDYAVLPWGATEPHNYHLPYMTDCFLAHDISLDAVTKAYRKAQVRGLVLPIIPLGSQNPGQRELPFCLHARYETQKAILTDIVASLDFQGIHNLIIINGHGGNNFKNMIRDLDVDYPHFVIAESSWFTIIPQGDYFEIEDSHAGELETSVMLHYRPDIVNMSIAGNGFYTPFKSQSLRDGVGWLPRHWGKVSKDTGVGDPRKASAEKGERYANDVTDKLADLFIDIAKGNIY